MGNTGQSDEDSTVRDTGQLIKGGIQAWLVGEGEQVAWHETWSIAPSYKTRSAYYKETLIGNAKRELAVA